MCRTVHNQIICMLKVEMSNSPEKKSSKGGKINTDLIEYVTKKLVKNN